jgi:serine protease AprX
MAPGNGTVSLMSRGSTLALTCLSCLVPNSYYQTNGVGTSGTYMRLSGTSMATPVVSGAVALLLQQNPSLTPDQVKARLMKSAQKVSTLYVTAHDHITLAPFSLQSDVFEVGAGYLDIQAALNNHDLTSLPALSASAILSKVNGVNQITISRNFASVWGSSVVWGDNVVYGTYVLAGLNSGGLSVLWGSSTIWGMDDGGGGFSVVWGDSLILPAVVQALDSGDGDYSVVWGD